LIICAGTGCARPMIVVAGGDLQLGSRSSAAQLAGLALLDGEVRFANLEGPITARGGEDEGAQKFAASPGAAAWLRGRLDVVSLANNHALDQGPAGRDDTVRALKSLGIAAATPEKNAVVRGLTVIAREFAPSADLDHESEVVEAVRRAARPVVVSLHWGHTGSLLPSPDQRRLAARLAEAGATAVLGHGPHTPQGIERHGRAIIAYSLGNLAFSCPCTDAGDAYLLRFRVARDFGADDVQVIPLRAGLRGDPPRRSDDPGLRQLLDELSRDLSGDSATRPGG
jgi:poly-gamma-glutamate synthesis protein (capsule biosynthesis protein)